MIKRVSQGISKCFPDEQLCAVHHDPWYVDIVTYLVAGRILEVWTKNDKERFFHLVKFFVWDNTYLFKYCSGQVFWRCIPDNEVRSVISFYHDHACGGILVGEDCNQSSSIWFLLAGHIQGCF